jgi:hypothetical protein
MVAAGLISEEGGGARRVRSDGGSRPVWGVAGREEEARAVAMDPRLWEVVQETAMLRGVAARGLAVVALLQVAT